MERTNDDGEVIWEEDLYKKIMELSVQYEVLLDIKFDDSVTDTFHGEEKLFDSAILEMIKQTILLILSHRFFGQPYARLKYAVQIMLDQLEYLHAHFMQALFRAGPTLAVVIHESINKLKESSLDMLKCLTKAINGPSERPQEWEQFPELALRALCVYTSVWKEDRKTNATEIMKALQKILVDIRSVSEEMEARKSRKRRRDESGEGSSAIRYYKVEEADFSSRVRSMVRYSVGAVELLIEDARAWKGDDAYVPRLVKMMEDRLKWSKHARFYIQYVNKNVFPLRATEALLRALQELHNWMLRLDRQIYQTPYKLTWIDFIKKSLCVKYEARHLKKLITKIKSNESGSPNWDADDEAKSGDTTIASGSASKRVHVDEEEDYMMGEGERGDGESADEEGGEGDGPD